MTLTTNRRSFLQNVLAGSAAVSLGAAFEPLSRCHAFAPNEQVHIGCVGVGGKGWSDMLETSVGHQIVAICDVDERRLEAAAAKFPKAKKYTDWRKLLELPGLNAVTVSTPDHSHAPVTMNALQRGLHVYTQKPLTHSVFESRQLARKARQAGVVTQMGIQHHSTSRIQNAVQIIYDGVIGRVREVHAWTDRPGSFWKQGLERPDRRDEVPPTLHWDQWLSVAEARPYVAGLYHPFHWRAWWDFGTGALGDMGCHILDPVMTALELTAPKAVWAEGPPPHPESGPLWCIVHYEFPGTPRTTDTLKLTWYEAGKQPPREIFLAPKDWPGSKNGVLYVGEKGNLFVGFPEPPQLFPVGEFSQSKMPDHPERNHYRQWTSAIAGTGQTTCPFDYSGPLTETVLLGNVAYRAGKKIQWNAESLTTGDKQADALLRRTYREGWEG